MEQYIIKGGNPLVGEVVIGGAKNAALPVLAAAVMTDGKCMIDNMPDVRDINVLLQAMQEIGADVDRTGKHEVTISGKGIHPECDVHSMRTIQKIKNRGVEAGIAINPGTAADTIRPLLSLADYVLVMGVNPGFAGQAYIECVDEKIDHLLELKKIYDFDIVLDGACSPERIASLSAKGVKGFVLGTSALFGKEASYSDIMKTLRAL